MDIFKVLLNKDTEYHFRMAMKAFDPYCIITHNKTEDSYSVKTNISIFDLKALTSVKKIIEASTTGAQQTLYDTDYYN